MTPGSTALVIVDVQNDFCEGGSIAVAGGAEVAAAITQHLTATGERYAHIVATRDWHVDPGDHFAVEPDYVDTWPPHCVAGTSGAQLHSALAATLIDATFDKGEREAAAATTTAALAAMRAAGVRLLGSPRLGR